MFSFLLLSVAGWISHLFKTGSKSSFERIIPRYPCIFWINDFCQRLCFSLYWLYRYVIEWVVSSRPSFLKSCIYIPYYRNSHNLSTYFNKNGLWKKVFENEGSCTKQSFNGGLIQWGPHSMLLCTTFSLLIIDTYFWVK